MSELAHTRSFGHGPFHRWLGLELLGRSSAAAETRLCVRPEFLQEEGVVQGGILSALADATAVYLLMPELAPGASLTSIEFQVHFLRPAQLAAGALHARADLVQGGRTLAVCRSVVSQAGESVAEALLTYLHTARTTR